MVAFVVEAAAVNPNGTKMLLTSVVSTIFINGKQAVTNSLTKLRDSSF